jgi:hypothetical protein
MILRTDYWKKHIIIINPQVGAGPNFLAREVPSSKPMVESVKCTRRDPYPIIGGSTACLVANLV